MFEITNVSKIGTIEVRM